MPRNSAGTATTNPAIGPATPTSNNAILSGKRDFTRMNAPSVPVSVKHSGGSGRKYGRVAIDVVAQAVEVVAHLVAAENAKDREAVPQSSRSVTSAAETSAVSAPSSRFDQRGQLRVSRW